MYKRILKKVQTGKITPKEAYNLIYIPKYKKARYISLKIKVKEEKWVNKLLNFIFFFPIPIKLGKPFIIKALKENGLSSDLYDVIKNYSNGFKIIVDSNDAKIRIKII